jgi:nucleotide-binding universal stress UspA family protein
MYKRILFYTDLYPGCDYAFSAALDLAERSQAELIVLHVLESRHRYSGHVLTENGEVWASSEVFEKLRNKLHTVRGSVLSFLSDRLRLDSNVQAVSLRARCPVSIVTSPKQRIALKALEA